MRPQDTRVVRQIAFAFVVWTSCLPVVSACDDCGMDDIIDGLSQPTLIGIIAACAALALFLGICGLYLRRRRVRQRATQLPRISYDQTSKLSSNPYAPVLSGYPVYHQAASPSLHVPRYPPQGYDTRHSNSHSQWPSSSNVYTIPEQVTPVSPASLRAPSGVTSRPISSFDTTSLPLRSSVRRDDPITNVSLPSSPPLSASPRSPQRNVVESPLLSLSPSPLPRSPSVATPPPSSPPAPHPSGAIPPPKTTRPVVLAPMDTGTTSSNNVYEAPPAYTPI